MAKKPSKKAETTAPNQEGPATANTSSAGAAAAAVSAAPSTAAGAGGETAAADKPTAPADKPAAAGAAGTHSTDDPRALQTDGGAGDAAGPAAASEAASEAASGSGSGLIAITVIGPAKGRRRAGRQFGPTPTELEVSPDEYEAIRADATLAVTLGTVSAAAAASGRRPSIEAFLDEDGSVRPVKVLGPVKGRRRAGYHFGPEAQRIWPSRAALEQILQDADLSVLPA